MPGEGTPGDVRPRDVATGDLPTFFEHQRDPGAVRMAAFTSGDPDDREAFDAQWARVLGDGSITIQTITLDGRVAGHVLAYGRETRGQLLGRTGVLGTGRRDGGVEVIADRGGGAAALRAGGAGQQRLEPGPGAG